MKNKESVVLTNKEQQTKVVQDMVLESYSKRITNSKEYTSEEAFKIINELISNASKH